jgi:hypothetical protein
LRSIRRGLNDKPFDKTNWPGRRERPIRWDVAAQQYLSFANLDLTLDLTLCTDLPANLVKQAVEIDTHSPQLFESSLGLGLLSLGGIGLAASTNRIHESIGIDVRRAVGPFTPSAPTNRRNAALIATPKNCYTSTHRSNSHR